MAWRALFAGGAGAAAYNAYQAGGVAGLTDPGSLWEVLAKRSSGAETARLQQQIESLQTALVKSFHDRQGGTIVIQGSGGKAGTATTLVVLGVVGGTLAYFRFVKGWTFADMLYVSNATLKGFQARVQESMEAAAKNLERAKRELQELMAQIKGTQDEMNEKTDQLGNKLGTVGSEVNQIGGAVAVLQGQTAYTNQAVTLLCGAVSEVCKAAGVKNGKYTRALDALANSTPHLPPPPGPAIIDLGAVGSSGVLALEGMPNGGAAAHHAPIGGSSAPLAPNPAVYMTDSAMAATTSGEAQGGRFTGAGAGGAAGRPRAVTASSVQGGDTALFREGLMQGMRAAPGAGGGGAPVPPPGSGTWFGRPK